MVIFFFCFVGKDYRVVKIMMLSICFLDESSLTAYGLFFCCGCWGLFLLFFLSKEELGYLSKGSGSP